MIHGGGGGGGGGGGIRYCISVLVKSAIFALKKL